jgi:hypothetical protein
MFADARRPIDTNDSVPDLHPGPPPRPQLLDAAAPVGSVCGAPIAKHTLACPAAYPFEYLCPRNANPTPCVRSTALTRPASKLVCCQ